MRFGLDEATIEKICNVISQFPEVEQVLIYSSRAKGTFRPGSDIDLTFKGERLNLKILNQLRNNLDQLNTPYSFDLSIYSEIENPDLIDHIKRIGQIFAPKNPIRDSIF